ncbi:hypothetical protein Tco_0743933, partial [Tanacetum coccineum]
MHCSLSQLLSTSECKLAIRPEGV